jgi:hypothetical protein
MSAVVKYGSHNLNQGVRMPRERLRRADGHGSIMA